MSKKIGLLIGVLLIGFLIYKYNNFYKDPEIRKSTLIKMKSRAILRALTYNDSWIKLFSTSDKKEKQSLPNSFYFNNKSFTIVNKTTNSISIKIANKESSLNSSLIIIPESADSTQLLWIAQTEFSKIPLELFKQIKIKKEISDDMSNILDILNNYYSKLKNVYGLDIHTELVVDSFLVFHSSLVNGFPPPSYIYSQLNNIEKFIAANGAKITGRPMLNIQTEDSLKYVVKVAYPVDKKLLGNKEFPFRGMLGRGKILQATIQGGYKNINKGFDEIKNYLYDYNIVVPAIPFESLITNRSLEKDTSKWITKIYCPIM